MADPESSTIVVNDCLFLNVLSFRYLDFEQLSEDSWGFTLFGDGSTLRLVSLPESEDDAEEPKRPHLLLEETMPDFESIIVLDDEDDEE
jgi:hypothetical protein